MEVISLSVSQPEKLYINGMEVMTSIVKEPLVGPVVFDGHGPVGNFTAVHPEAVYAFIDKQYNHWAGEWSVDRSEWRYGRWGENITVSGLDERELLIGDILRFKQCVFQVTSPRIPCFKLSWRLGQPESVLDSLKHSGLMGFYLRVITPGALTVGDTFELERPYPDNLSVAALSALLHHPDTTAEELLSALKMQGLSRLPTEFLQHRYNQVTDVAIARKYRWKGWREFTVARVKSESDEVKSFYLTPSDGQPIAGYRPGQFLTIKVPHSTQNLMRLWSLSDYCQDSGFYRLSIKRQPFGVGSTWMHENALPGTRLMVKNPSGNFTLNRSSPFPTVLISGGIGITPMISMLRGHIERGLNAEAPPLIWIHCTRDGDSHVFRDEVQEIIRTTNIEVRQLVLYSEPSEKDKEGIDYGRSGYLSIDDVAKLLSGLKLNIGGRYIELPPQAADFYMCGPAVMQKALSEALLNWGVKPTSIYTEVFAVGTAETEIAGKVLTSLVTFSRSGLTMNWDADDELTLLELAESEGLVAASSCRAGQCHTCKVRITEGEVVHRSHVEGLDDKHILPCCAFPASEQVVIEL